MTGDQRGAQDRDVSLIRSQLMARIHGRDTSPELILRKALWSAGLRYRVNHPTPAGRPDIAFTRQKVAIFIDGCFWHGCPNHYVKPRSRSDFWAGKLRTNFERDRRQTQRLESDGWKVYRVWEHQIFESLPSVVSTIQKALIAEHYEMAEMWRVVKVDTVDDQLDIEKQSLCRLVGDDEERVIIKRRTTTKWRRAC